MKKFFQNLFFLRKNIFEKKSNFFSLFTLSFELPLWLKEIFSKFLLYNFLFCFKKKNPFDFFCEIRRSAMEKFYSII